MLCILSFDEAWSFIESKLQEVRQEERKRIRSWANRTHPITYKIIDFDIDPQGKYVTAEAVDKKALLSILKEEK